jgi:hypothetical protein
VGSYFVVNDGRHNTAAIRVGRQCLDGTRHVAAIAPLIMKLREERGESWRPVLTALPPATSAETGEAMNAASIADLSQVQRVLTTAELYERCMRRVRACRASSVKPDFASIGRDNGQTAHTVEDWERLSKMPRVIREYVLVGHNSRTLPLTTAVGLRKLGDDAKIIAAAQEMLEQGNTTVAAMKATVRAAQDNAADLADRGGSSEGFTGRDGGRHEGGEGHPAEEQEADEEHVEKDAPKKPKSTASGPMKARDFRKFIDEGTGAPDRESAEWRQLMAFKKLFTESMDLTKAELEAVGLMGVLLDAHVNRGACKLAVNKKRKAG